MSNTSSNKVTTNEAWGTISEFFKAGNLTEEQELWILLKFIEILVNEEISCKNLYDKIKPEQKEASQTYQTALSNLHELLISNFATNPDAPTQEEKFKNIPSQLSFLTSADWLTFCHHYFSKHTLVDANIKKECDEKYKKYGDRSNMQTRLSSKLRGFEVKRPKKEKPNEKKTKEKKVKPAGCDK